MAILTTDNPYVDMDVAIDSLVARYAERATDTRKGPQAEARAISQLQSRLDKLYEKFQKFELKVEADKAAKLNLGYGEVFTVAKAAGLASKPSSSSSSNRRSNAVRASGLSVPALSS